MIHSIVVVDLLFFPCIMCVYLLPYYHAFIEFYCWHVLLFIVFISLID